MRDHGSVENLSSEVGGLTTGLQSHLGCDRCLWLDADRRTDGQGDQQRVESG